MSYKIIPTKEFIKDSKKIDSATLNKVKDKIEEVAKNPERYKHLRGPLKVFCRIRIEKLRVLFSYESLKKEIYPEKIIFSHNY